MKRARHLLGPLALAVAILHGGEAQAHKIKLFAAADGAVIRGYAYVPGGGRLRSGTIEVWVSDQEKVATLAVDEKGEFQYTATQRCDHRFVLALEDGHAATFTVAAAELPASLPAQAGGEALSRDPLDQPLLADAPAEAPPSAADASFGEEIGRLRQQVTALREELDAFQERRSLQDLIGGAGYLLGVAGIAFYLLGRQRNRPA